ncbi:DNase, TatD family (EC 3.1.-.-) [Mycetohabitans rhizoxinica HKI 454]|jgi:TatD DNase family protein|uniref:DNase, TatD family n=2 Tax=Mycetohabitans rhizoxinica TaxID=412963 RepID=E5ARC9_MYCRK|nr:MULTISPECIES: TatD family hydrolase [Mycetohabitans]MCF7695888.1 TatD family hydrolase [Mycetohabitans sp. B2]MCG1047223.1 TatD family hydrolase [Mycetohabitans sp. B6]CBW75161.1 DNase, TatD family (EC 3.1.-.-) [Mycetohabitans rhizoxinica HKI 454]
MFIDSHCHINFDEMAQRLPDVLEKMRVNAVTHALCVSVDLETFPSVLAIAHAHPHIFASVGVHPDHEHAREPDVTELVSLAQDPKVVAIGETGLDYYRLEGRTLDDMAWQRQRFRTHIQAARAAGKPLIVHTRAAAQDTLRIMQEEGAAAVGGVMHCFTETWDIAQAALEQNFFISLSGIVTFKNATQIQEVARKLPLERLLIETDSPYLAPVPYRGKPNEPAYVSHVGRFIAQLRGIDAEQLGAATSTNFFRLFRGAES